MEIIDLG